MNWRRILIGCITVGRQAVREREEFCLSQTDSSALEIYCGPQGLVIFIAYSVRRTISQVRTRAEPDRLRARGSFNK